MLPLTFVKTGDIVKVQKVLGNDESKKHLNDLGFVNGSVVNVISSHNGDIILSIKDSRLAVTKSMADKIMIDIVDEKELLKSKVNSNKQTT
ncbi:MAG: ferrous iron transport protein A [Lachnospiraceae bacterium]|nr:ferrous iron transport protein A [Lachnospiraceae bacterium]